MDILPRQSQGDENEACPSCGLTRRELYSHGQMGCVRCYETFAAEVQRALKEIHGETRHLGKNAL
jgi:protein arginine kinase activator